MQKYTSEGYTLKCQQETSSHGTMGNLYTIFFASCSIECELLLSKNILIQLQNVFQGVVVGADFTIFHVKKKKAWMYDCPKLLHSQQGSTVAKKTLIPILSDTTRRQTSKLQAAVTPSGSVVSKAHS